MNKFIKYTAFISVLIIVLLISIKNISGSNNKAPREEKSTVVFWTLQLSTFDKYINGVIKEFEKDNPDIYIKWIDIPYSEGEKRTLASVLTDSPPDLVNITPDFSLLLAKKKALYFIDKEQMKEYVPAVSDLLKYEDKYFGIPFYATSAITLYNKELLKKYEIKTLPKTYDDIFKYNGRKPNNSYLTMINLCENDTAVKLLNKYEINTPETIKSEKSSEIFNEIKNMYEKGLIPTESVTQTHRDALEKYMAGNLVFLVTGANFLNMIKENAPKVYEVTGILPQLTGESGLYDCSVMNFIIPQKAKNKENALKFALFFTNKTNQLEFAKLTGVLPVNKEALEDDYFKESGSDITNKSEYFSSITKSNENQITKALKIGAYQLNYLQPPFSYSTNKKEINTIYSESIQKILINKEDTNEVLNNLSENMSKL